jgi:outer membrane protein assembly factor BamB
MGGAGGSGQGGSGAGGRGSGGMAGTGAGGSGQAGSGSGGSGLGGAGGGGASVLQHHRTAWRDGLYIDPIFTKAAASKVHMDTTFKSTIQGPTYAQPLYFENGPGGKDIVIVATEQNQVYALDAANGSVVWQKQVGTPVAQGSLPCGNINPLGITGTPVIDAPSRTLFFDAMTTPDGGSTKKRLIFALSIDDGSTRTGWPVDVSAVARSGALTFDSSVQSQRGALALVGGTVYVAYGGHWGDCGSYHGWVVGVPIANPSGVKAYATTARGAGIWGPGGVVSDGTSLFVATGNSMGTNGTWGHGEAVLRLTAGPAFSGQAADYFAPSNWKALDDSDTDLGGSNPVLVDVPGANPSHLVVALGKNSVAYLINRANLGGIGTGNGMTGEAVASMRVASNAIIQASAVYTTAQGTFVAMNAVGLCPGGGFTDMSTIKISATSPPQISMGWCQGLGGFGSPIVTTTDGRSEAVVWAVGSGNHLIAFDGDAGTKLMAAGSNVNDGMTEVANRQTPIVAKGRIFVAANNNVYAFKPQ